ncbi:hypothetical protein MUO83_08785 [Candidatus Bathyarchaeota archaeon]|nr:hypothetical protein [Candidatus Bathyarchaeota archaeon]
MNKNVQAYLIVACFCTLVLFLGILQLRLDFNRSIFSTGDIVYMFPLSTWIYLMFLPVGFFLIRKFDKRLSWVIPFALAILLYVVFPIVQYPSIFYWDTFYHGTTAKYIIDNGNFSTNTGYFQYPGAFILSGVVSEVLGLPIIETSMLLASFLVILVAFLLFAVGRLFAKTESALVEMGWLVPTICLTFNFSFLNGAHYSPQLLGLCLFILFLIINVKSSFKIDRSLLLALLVLLPALTITHVFSAAMTVTCLLCVLVGGPRIVPSKLRGKHFVTLILLLLAVVLFISWNSFVADAVFRDTTNFLALVMRGGKTLFGARAGSILFSPLAGSLTPALGLYRYGVYASLAFASILGLILFWSRMQVKLVFLLALGVLLGTVVIYLTPATFGVGRILFYGGVIISILASYAIMKQNVKFLALSRVQKMLKMILPFLVIGTFVVSNLYYSTYALFMHPDEISSFKFIAEKVRRQISIEIDQALAIPFYAKEPIPMLIIDERAPSDIAKMKFESGDLSLQYLPRQLYYYNLSFIEGNSSLIYSNGLARLYAKTNSNSP